MVTEADFSSSTESDEFLKELQAIVRTLEISTADMEKGSMRLEANISVKRPDYPGLPDYKVEIKNVNSFRFIKKAIDFEVSRQINVLESGVNPIQETRGFKENTGETFSQRAKEEAHDYRYFPDPDIPPLEFTQSQISIWRRELPELPAQKRLRLIQLGLTATTAAILVDSSIRYAKFTELSANHDPIDVAKLLVNLPEDKVSDASINRSIDTLNNSEAEIRDAAIKVIADNPKAVTDIKSGKSQVIFFLIGQIKKELGDVDVSLTQKIIDEIIKS